MNTNTIGIGRRLLSMLLAFVMVFGMLPTFAFAEEEHVHTWGEWTVSAAPTCTAQGQMIRSCADCGAAETTVISPNGHSWSDWTVTAYPSCIETGSRMHSCTVCGEVETETIPANGHTWSDWTVTVEPDCVNAGEKIRSCSVCGTLETEAVPALGHSFGDWQTTAEPDCTKDGSKERICSVCNEKETEAIPALGHSFGDWQITAEPDCTDAGSKERICSACNEKETEAIPALGHSFGDWQTTAEPNCTNAGSKERICSVCGEKETEAIDALGHDWGEWEIVTEATCDEDGEKIRTCSACEETETDVIPAAHKWGEWEIVTEATCTEDGEQVRVCDACGETETEKIPALGHKWDVEDEDEESTCTVCGEHREAKYNIIVDGQRWCKLNEEDGNVETAEDWAAMFYSYYPTGDWAKDLLTIASSQLGYKGVNLINKNGDVVNYSRYGHWYGMPFGSWCAMFISFCLHYAQVPTSAMPIAASCESWVSSLSGSGKYASAGTYSPKPGDLIFFDYFPYDSIPDHVGIVNSFNEENGLLVTIEGATNNIVKIHRYNISDRDILGFGIMPENPALIVAEPEIITETIEREQRSISGTANGRTVTVSGVLPVDATLQVVAVPDDTARSIEAAQGGSDNAEIVFAFDISIISGGEKYDLEEYSDSITVSVSGISDADSVSVTHYKIDLTNDNGSLDAGQINIAQTTKLDSEDLATDTEGSSVFFDLSSCSYVRGIKSGDSGDLTPEEKAEILANWPNYLKEQAALMYGPNGQITNPISLYINGPLTEPTNGTSYMAGDYITYDFTFTLNTPASLGFPYDYATSMFDEYENVYLEFKLPAGLILTEVASPLSFTDVTPSSDTSGAHTYRINIDTDSNPTDGKMAPGGRDNVQFIIFVQNNGTANAINLDGYSLNNMATLHAEWHIIDKLNGAYTPVPDVEYDKTVQVSKEKIVTDSPDVWSAKKTAGTVTTPNGTGTATFTWTIDVGLKNGDTDVFKEASHYNGSGRDAVTSLTLDESLSAVIGKRPDETILNPAGADGKLRKVTIKKNGGTGSYVIYDSSQSIDRFADPITVWGEDEISALRLNVAYVDHDGDKNKDYEVPAYTSYTVTAEYEVTQDMIAQFYEENGANYLESENTVTLTADLAKKTEQSATKTAKEGDYLSVTDPSKLTVDKRLQTVNGESDYSDDLIDKYGEISYSIKASDDRSIKVFEEKTVTEGGTTRKVYELVGEGTTVTQLQADKEYCLVPGITYVVTENPSDKANNNTDPVSVTPVNGTFTASSTARTVTFVNKLLRGQILIYKTDNASPARPLPNVKFKLVDSTGHQVGELAETNGSGFTSFTDLPYGTYTLSEESAPTGYEPDNEGNGLPMTITIGEGEGAVVTWSNEDDPFVNPETKASIRLTKYVGVAQESVTSFPRAHANNGRTDFATFKLYRSTDPNSTDWELVDEDYLGEEINTSLSAVSEITAEVPAKDGSGNPYYYKFVETIKDADKNLYYPVIASQNDDTITYSNAAVGTTTSETVPKKLTYGVTNEFPMYNRKAIRITVNKRYFTIKNNGSTDQQTGNNYTAEFTLYKFVGAGSPTQESQLEKYTVAGVTNPQEAGTTESGIKARWENLPLYAGTDKVTYYIRETAQNSALTDTYVWVGTDNQAGKRVRIPDNESGHWYVKIDIDPSTSEAGFSTVQDNTQDIIPITVKKYNTYTKDYMTKNCKFTVYTDPDLAETHIANNAKANTNPNPLKNVTITPNIGTTFFLEGGKKYYYVESELPEGYVFVSLTSNGDTFVDEATGRTVGVIDLTDVHQPDSTGVKVYEIKNKPEPNIIINKKNSAKPTDDVTGAEFSVFTLDGTTGNYKPYLDKDGHQVVISATGAASDKRLPAGTYYFAETTVPGGYLNPNTEAGCTAYNALSESVTYQRGTVSGGDYDGQTLTFVEAVVTDMANSDENTDDNTCSFTFYNIPLKGSVQVQKTLYEQVHKKKDFVVNIVRADDTNTPPTVVGTATTNSNGIATISDLDVFDEDGTKITYKVLEGDIPSSLADVYYKVSDGQTFQLEPGKTVSKDNSDDKATLRVDNAKYFKVVSYKDRQNGWFAHIGSNSVFPMNDAVLGLFRRPAGSTEDWTRVAVGTTSGGSYTFEHLERGTGGTDGVEYDYIVVELATGSNVYEPYNNGPRTCPVDGENTQTLSGTLDELKALYNVVTVPHPTNDENEVSTAHLLNSSHWVQFHITKYKDDKSLSDNLDTTTPSDPHDTTTGHSTEIIAPPDEPLNDCVFSLWYCVIDSNTTEVTFNPSNPGAWTRVGTYTSGSLLDLDTDTRFKGQFLTNVFEGKTNENGELIEGVNSNYVFLLVEDNVGPNSVTPNPYFEHLFWYAAGRTPEVTCFVDGEQVLHGGTYNIDAQTEGASLNSWDGDGPGHIILLASLRLAKWWDDYNSNGQRNENYRPLNNVTFNIYLPGKTEPIGTMTTGLDGDNRYSVAVSGTFRLLLPTNVGNTDGKYHLIDYEVPSDPVDLGVVEVEVFEESETRIIYGVPVNIVEDMNSLPEGYGGIPKTYETYLIFVNTNPSATRGTYTFYNDLYYVKEGGQQADNPNKVPLAEYQQGRLWHARNIDDSSYEVGSGPQQRIVNYPMNNTPVEVIKVGYQPTESNKGRDSQWIALNDSSAIELDGVTMVLQHKNASGGWEFWNYLKNEPGTEAQATFTIESGSFTFPDGLSMGAEGETYRIYEKSIGAGNSEYENAYPGPNGPSGTSFYRTFFVGGQEKQVYMANPRMVSLAIEKKDLITGVTINSGMTFKLTAKNDTTHNKESSVDTQNPGTYRFDDIASDVYVLTETAAPTGYTTAYFKDWFIQNNGSYADLVGSNGRQLGYTYKLSGSEKDSDVTVETINDLGTTVLTLTVKDPPTGTVTLKKVDKDNQDTQLNGAIFQVFRTDFKRDGQVVSSGDVSVTLPATGADYDTTRDNYLAADWTVVGNGYTVNGMATISDLAPGVYAFYENVVPEGHDPALDANGHVLIFTAVIKCGLDVNVTVTPGEGGTPAISDIITNFVSETNGKTVTVTAVNPEKARLTALKEVLDGQLNENNNQEVGRWEVKLNIYEYDESDPNDTGTLVGTATIDKRTRQTDQSTGEPLVYFKDGTKDAYFTVGKAYYVEEVVTTVNNVNNSGVQIGNGSDAAHLTLTKLEIVGSSGVLQPDPNHDNRYKITIADTAGFTIKATNQYLYGMVKFLKFDMGYSTISGAKFEVRHLNAENKWVKVENSTVIESNGIYTAYIPLDGPGEIHYRIYETEAPSPYVIDPDPDKTYIDVVLTKDENVKDFTEDYTEDTIIRNPTGNPLEITKWDNIHDAVTHKEHAKANSVTFRLYHWDTSVTPNKWVLVHYVSINNEGKAVFNGEYSLAPGEIYAVVEVDPDTRFFSGFDSMYIGDTKLDLDSFSDDRFVYPSEDTMLPHDYTNAYIFRNTGTVGTIKIDAYNIPNIKPVIAKVDVGKYPTGVVAQMDFNIYEVPLSFEATNDSVDALLSSTPDNDTGLPRRLFAEDWTTTQDYTDENGNLGTKITWESATVSERWDPTKHYIIVETKVKARSGVYDTMVKDNDRVTWFYDVKPSDYPDPNPAADMPALFKLENINGAADVTLTKSVITADNAPEGITSEVTASGDTYSIGTLLKQDRYVGYTLTPTVTGMNQMLRSFVLEDSELSPDPSQTPEGSTAAFNFSYAITQLNIGKASQKYTRTDSSDPAAQIYATVTFKLSTGGTQDVPVGTVTAPAGVTDPLEYGTVPVTVPDNAISFSVRYYSEEVMTDTGYEETTEGVKGYQLGEEFRVGPTTVAITVDKTPNSAGNPTTEIKKFTNNAKATLVYPKWEDDGSACTDIPKEGESSATIQVDPVVLPTVEIDKTDNAANGIASTNGILKYIVTVTNTSTEGADFENPVVLDILPTGVKFFYSLPNYGITVDQGTNGENIILGENYYPIEGTVAQTGTGSQGEEIRDAETCVIFEFGGDPLKAESSFTFSFYATVTDNALAYKEEDDTVRIRNDVYLTSAKHSYYTDWNQYGYSFADRIEGGKYVWGNDIATEAASQSNASKTHENGVHNYIGDYKDGTLYTWVSNTDPIPVVNGGQIDLKKYGRGNRDQDYHSDYGMASRTTYYHDVDSDFTDGFVDWRLSISAGISNPVTGLVVGDVVSKVGDRTAFRPGSEWDVVFDRITSVIVDAEPIYQGPDTDQYQVWYYTGATNGASAKVNEALLHAREDGYLADHGWTQKPFNGTADPDNATTTEKESITAFLVVFGSDITIEPGHAAMIGYHTIVKAVPLESEFDEIAFTNAVNDFQIKYDQNPDIKISNPVSITLIDKDVEIQGDVWIDEDWDNLQEPDGNRRNYDKYAIVKLLADNISFKVWDMRSSPATSRDENDPHGTNTMDESIRHFTFLKLSPALWMRLPLYDSDKKIRKQALKGENPAIYEISASIKADYVDQLSQIFTLTGNIDEPLPDPQDYNSEYVGYYVSDNPDDLTKNSTNSRDNNFKTTSGMNYRTYPFFVRYSQTVDESKDIGFRMVRGLEITKVAKDSVGSGELELLSGAKFQIYGPFSTATGVSGKPMAFIDNGEGNYTYAPDVVVTGPDEDGNYEAPAGYVVTLETFKGKIVVTGLNWWKEYVVKETFASSGFSVSGAVSVATDVPEGGWTDEDDEAYSEVEDLGDGVFILRTPGTGRTEPIHQVQVQNPRGIPFMFEKLGEVPDDVPEYLNGIKFGLYLDQECTDENKALDSDGNHIIAVSGPYTDEQGTVHQGVVRFPMLLLPYGVQGSNDYFSGIYYMKELEHAQNSLYWDNSTIYKLEVIPQQGETPAHVKVTSIPDPDDSGSNGGSGNNNGGSGNSNTGSGIVTATGEAPVTTIQTGSLSEDGTGYTILNELKKYRIKIIKKDGKDNTKPIVGAEFELYDTDPAASSGGSSGSATGSDKDAVMKIPLDAKAITPVKFPADARADAAATRDGATPAVPIITGLKTGQDGKVDLGVLVPGTYYLVETKSPPDYYLLNAPVKIVIAIDGKVTVTYKKLTINGEQFVWTETTEEHTATVPNTINTQPQELTALEFNIYDYPKYGSLQIKKFLSTYKRNDTATFIFDIVGTLEGKTVYTAVATLTLSNTNTQTAVLHYVPAGAHISVTERYTGSHYELDNCEATQTTVIVANETVSVNFTNKLKYDDIDGHGIENVAEPNGSGGWSFTGKYPTTPAIPAVLPDYLVTGDDTQGGSGGASGDGSGGDDHDDDAEENTATEAKK